MSLLVRLLIATIVAYVGGSLQLILFGKMKMRSAAELFSKERRLLAFFVVLFDIGKGLAAIPSLSLILGRGTGNLILIPAFTVVLGHSFSIFLRFRGGSGAAPTAGIVLFALAYGAWVELFPIEFLVIAFVAALLLFVAVRRIELPGLLLATTVWLALVFTTPWVMETIALGIGGVLLAGFALDAVSKYRLLNWPSGSDIRMWRIAARPFALLFIVIDQLWGRRLVLLIMGVVAAIFLCLDIVRLLRRRNGAIKIYKKKEARTLSSMSLFLGSSFLVFLLFPGGIPYIAFTCITVGDFFSKIVGIQYGKRKIYHSRTLEGSLAFLAGSLSVGLLVAAYTGVPLLYMVSGSFIATIVELLSWKIDDNFSVSIATGGALALIRLLFPL